MRIKNCLSQHLTAGISMGVFAVWMFLLPSVSMGGEPAHEVDVTISGKLSTMIGDPPSMLDKPVPGSKNQSPVVEHFLTDGQGKTVAVIIPPKLMQSVGAYQKLRNKGVTVRGKKDTATGQITLDSIEPSLAAAGGAGGTEITSSYAPSTGSTPWAAVLCRFGDMPSVTPHDVSWFNTLMGSSYPGMDHFWQENSYNQMNLLGSQVYGWYNLPLPKSAYFNDANFNGSYDPGELDKNKIINDCATAADADVYFPNFVGINLMLNDTLDGVAWGGSTPLNMDGQDLTYSFTLMPTWAYGNQNMLVHEMGHGYGLLHSGGQYDSQYDSMWDPMSSGGSGNNLDPQFGKIADHTISFHKDQLGWIPPGRKFVAMPGTTSQIFIERMAQPVSTTSYLMAQIPFFQSDWYAYESIYTVEARRYAGYDQEIPGEAVIIHSHGIPYRSGGAEVIDPDNNYNPNDEGAMWTVGETYSKPGHGISVTIDSMTSTGYYVTISNYPPNLPDLVGNIYFPSFDVPIGGSLNVIASVFNEGVVDTTASSTTGAVYLSTDPTITTEDTLLGTWVSTGQISAMTSGPGTSVSITLPSTLVHGALYYLGAIADINNEQPEADETNNTKPIKIHALRGVDLIVTNVSTTASEILNGGSATVNATVKNQGLDATANNTTIDIYLSTDPTITAADTWIAGFTVDSGLQGGSEQRVSSTIAIPTNLALGKYYLGAIADYANTQPEVMENNNVLTGASINVIALPTVTTYPAESITMTCATFPAAVNPNGGATTVWFKYKGGHETSWNTTISQVIGDVTYPINISQEVCGLMPGAFYYFYVEGQNSAGSVSDYYNNGSYQTLTTLQDLIAPSAPSNLTAVGGVAKIDLSWVAATDNVGVYGYDIERCAGKSCSNFGKIGSVSGDVTSYRDYNVLGGTTYKYQVKAFDWGGNLSTPSNIVKAAVTTPKR